MSRQRRSSESTEPRPLRKGGATSADERVVAKLIEGYPPPPPDPLTVQRIWLRVVSAPGLRASGTRPRLRDVRVLASGVALCLGAALAFVLLHGPAGHGSRAAPAVTVPLVGARPVDAMPAAELAAAQGGVFFARPAERWQPVKEGQPLAEGQSLRTDPGGQAVMNVPGIASILISRGTDVIIERLAGATFLRLSRGSVVARVSKRPPGEPLFILVHDFSVKVVGTLFRVDQIPGKSKGHSPGQDSNDRTAVSVREGLVEVTGADGRTWRVGAGQAWSSDSPELPSQIGASAIADPVKTLLEDGLKRANPADLDRELAALDGNAVGAGSGLDGAGPRGGEAASSLGGTSPHTRHAGAGVAGGAASARLPPAPVILAASDPVRAAESVPGPDSFPTRAEKSDPEHAELALYALGRLRQHRLHDPQGALEAFESYRTTYPSGHLLPEVDLAILEIQVAAGHRDRALAESVRFLASHPASERIVEVHLLRGDLLRERGDCRSALAEYRQVDAAAFAPLAEDALFETAYCQRKLGDAAAAGESLRQYQRRYPAGTHRDDVAKALRE